MRARQQEASVSAVSAHRVEPTPRRTAHTVARIGHGVFVLLTAVLGAIWLAHWAGSGPLPWVVGGMLLVVAVRVGLGRGSGADQVLLVIALGVTFWFGERQDVAGAGVGADATPAFSIFVVAMMLPRRARGAQRARVGEPGPQPRVRRLTVESARVDA